MREIGIYEDIIKILISEYIGTFILVFVGCLVVALNLEQGNDAIAVAFAFGLALMFVIYMFGDYSGINFNPAVTLSYALNGDISWGLMIAYWIMQFLGGITAAALVIYFLPNSNGGISVGNLTYNDQWKAIVVETIVTFVLILTILIITNNYNISPIVIGLTLTIVILSSYSLTGCSTNPARTFGPAILNNQLDTFWIYLVGPLFGSILAAAVYRLFTYNFDCCYKYDECGKLVYDECGNAMRVCEEILQNDIDCHFI